ncbi:MAG: hypothetical protein GC181_06110 [Bacteroidetes bacterium]|nr:hypothetical protein [Bacteroidota bacterium]
MVVSAMKNFIVILLFLISGLSAFAQREFYQWRFGQYGSLDFNTGTAVQSSGSDMATNYACASIADSAGSLLFYTDGTKIWNRENVLMDNGINLRSGNGGAQNVFISKSPGKNQYYVFTAYCYKSSSVYLGGLYYSIVDMDSSGGLGKVTELNTKISGYPTSKIAGIKHANGSDFWILSHEYETDSMEVFRLSASGLSAPQRLKTNCSFTHEGQMKLSPDGSKLAIAYPFVMPFGGLALFDFNRNTGRISNRKFYDRIESVYGIEFSPSSEILYFTDLKSGSLHQLELKNFTADASFPTLSKKIYGTPGISIGSLQFAPDRKIYMAINGAPSLAVIEQPDFVGSACDFKASGVTLTWSYSGLGLPVFDPSSIYIENISAVGNCAKQEVANTIIAYKADSIRWLFGDGNTELSAGNISHYYQTKGNYLVKAVVFRKNQIDTLYHPLTIYSVKKPDLGKDSILCTGDSIYVDLSASDWEMVFWLDGDSSKVRNIGGSGFYEVEVSNHGCVDKDTVEFRTTGCVLQADNFCVNDTTLLSLPFTKADSFHWDFGDGNYLNNDKPFAYHIYSNKGNIPVSVTYYLDQFQKTLYDTIQMIEIPVPDIGNDVFLCAGDTSVISAWRKEYEGYEWSTGQTDSAIKVWEPGMIWVKVHIGECIAGRVIQLDTIDCGIRANPVCVGDTMFISLNHVGFDSVNWTFPDGFSKSGNRIATHSFNNNGKFEIAADAWKSDFHFKMNDLVEVKGVPHPGIHGPLEACDSTFLTTRFGETLPGMKFQWNNGSDRDGIHIKESGTYSVRVEYEGCIAEDSVDVIIRSCECALFFPNAFTPNQNNLNETFGPMSNCNWSTFEFVMFNRWGEIIFKSDNPSLQWDGKYLKELCATGVFGYQFRGVNEFGKLVTESGTVHLLR